MQQYKEYPVPDQLCQIGRLALRAEGKLWNAYFAKPGTMEDAIYLGSIKLDLAMSDEECKRMFIELMTKCVSNIIEDVSGIRPMSFGEVPAPESERSGNA